MQATGLEYQQYTILDPHGWVQLMDGGHKALSLLNAMVSRGLLPENIVLPTPHHQNLQGREVQATAEARGIGTLC